MGARAAVMAAAELLEEEKDMEIKLILVSYPLKGPKDIRDQILLDLPAKIRVLFIIGGKDAMCPLKLLEEVRDKMEARGQLLVVRGADHGMHISGGVEKERGEETGRMAAKWVDGEEVWEEDARYVGEEG